MQLLVLFQRQSVFVLTMCSNEVLNLNTDFNVIF